MLQKFLFLAIYGLFRTAGAVDYCLSIRGNGELAPAHWGAMATVVEKLGLPKAQAGGSSASISIFLLDSIASSEYVKTNPESAAFFLKSLEGFSLWIKNQKEWQDFAILAGQAQNLGSIEWSKDLKDFFSSIDDTDVSRSLQSFYDQLSRIEANLRTGKRLNLVNMESLNRLAKAIDDLKNAKQDADILLALKAARFYSGEIYKTYEVFGKFNAQSDHNLFFRSGFIDFDGLAIQLGRIGALYASASAINPQWQELYTTCSESLKGRLWSELLADKPHCQDLLENAIDSTFRYNKENFSEKEIGQSIASFPITSVLIDSAYDEAKMAQALYYEKMDPEFGKTFVLSNPEDVRFGYWGNLDALKKIDRNLDFKDAKSRRFLALGEATWSEALRLSPAEPGLSALKEFKSQGERYLSAGGWPDLTPTLILKAYGCENVVHITRRGGESLFAQGVAKRLLNLNRDWDFLSTEPKNYEKNWVLNNQGDSSDVSSDWADLYNLANNKSSIRQSIAAADAVLCTNWNQFSITSGPAVMIDEAYRSPFYVNPDGGLAKYEDVLQPSLKVSQRNPDGYPEYVGCIP